MVYIFVVKKFDTIKQIYDVLSVLEFLTSFHK